MENKKAMNFNHEDGSQRQIPAPGESRLSSIHMSLPTNDSQWPKREGDTREMPAAAESSCEQTNGPHSSHSRHSSRDSIDSETSSGNSSDTDGPESEGSSSSDGTEAIGSANVDTDEGHQGPKEAKTSEKGEKKPLRKGKWAVEEEEYTSRVIQHFSAGLLTLPDGATLRSYLAGKLHCDPMRITKKFTGACCLGRRVYHLRDRPRATPAELEIAKAERDHLERRFRLRIEHEQSGLPLSRRREMLLAQPQSNIGTIYPLQNFTTGNTLSPWLNNLGAGLAMGAQHSLPLTTGNHSFPSGAQAQLSPNVLQHNTSRWLLPGASESMATNSQVDPSIQLLNNLVTSWAVAQAAASLPPATLASLTAGSSAVGSIPLSSIISHHLPSTSVAERAPSQPNLELQLQLQLHLRNVQEEQRKEEEQRQLRAAFEEEKRKKEVTERAAAAAVAVANASMELPKLAAITTTATNEGISPAEQLQKSYEAHLLTLRNIELSKGQKGNTLPTPEGGSKKEGGGNQQPMADEEAGTVLLGFLNSLRQSYEDAVEEKAGEPLDEPVVKNTKTKPEKSQLKFQKMSSSVSWKQKSEKPRSNTKVGVKRPQGSVSNGTSPNNDKQNGQNLSSAVSQFMNSKAGRRSQRPASVTDASSGNSSSQPAEFSSSLEDSSDKTDPSSSEESEKEDRSHIRRASKGPPRKRLKAFTAENLIAHSKRMSEGGGGD